MDILNSNLYAQAEEAIEIFRRGEILILVDNENRENEGDFVMAGDAVSPQAINFMTLYGRGLVCLSITTETAKRLDLHPMVSENSALLETAFTVSVDASERNTTGISAQDRSETIKVIIDPNSVPSDLARPGHLFPLIAREGGVLSRPGHTEAVVDLARLADRSPAGILCEILDDDGSMARMPRLMEMAEEHNMKIALIDDLVLYLQKHRDLKRNFMIQMG